MAEMGKAEVKAPYQLTYLEEGVDEETGELVIKVGGDLPKSDPLNASIRHEVTSERLREEARENREDRQHNHRC